MSGVSIMELRGLHIVRRATVIKFIADQQMVDQVEVRAVLVVAKDFALDYIAPEKGKEGKIQTLNERDRPAGESKYFYNQ